MAGRVLASCGFSPWLVLPHEQATGKLFKEHLPFVPSDGTNLEMVKSSAVNLKLQKKGDFWKTMCMLLDTKQMMQMNTRIMKHLLVDVQAESQSDLVLFNFRFADLMDSQEIGISMSQRKSASPYLAEPHTSLIYPSSSFSLQIPPSDVVGVFDLEIDPLSHGQLPHCDVKSILSLISEHCHFMNQDSVSSPRKPMLVPYFDRKMIRETKVKSSALELKTLKAATLTSPEELKDKRSPKKKSNKKQQIKDRDLFRNSSLHAFEILLSIMVNTQQHGKTAISSLMALKKSGGELPHLLTRLSATITGTAIAVLLSGVCKVACGKVVTFRASSGIINAGIGIALVWLSWGVNSLRDTVISISKSPGKFAVREEEMIKLDRDVKEIYYRAAALMAVVVLRFV
ncbi:unnamed protein product [Cuscuta epithymum]|uniref:Uncharacterized protein n=1 Tax=Cuscuta epithymum TaxID=186058 RepID=A0AAV0FZG5_9ASTE|nr:unnamed protein product [Cuscuta epithymum]